jgi:hypothetical protein
VIRKGRVEVVLRGRLKVIPGEGRGGSQGREVILKRGESRWI